MELESLTCMFVKPKKNLKELMSFKLTISSTKNPSCFSVFLSKTFQLVQLLRSLRSISQLLVREKSIESTWSKELSKHLLILKSKISVKWLKILQEMCFSRVRNQLSIFKWVGTQTKENLILWTRLAIISGKINSSMEAKIILDKIPSISSRVSFLSNQDTKTGTLSLILCETSN